MARGVGFPIMVGEGRRDAPFRNIKTLMGGFGFSDGCRCSLSASILPYARTMVPAVVWDEIIVMIVNDMNMSSASYVGPKFAKPYLLAVPVAFYRDKDGKVWLDRLWHRDLMEHTVYLGNITVLAPQADDMGAITDAVKVEVPESSLRFVPSGKTGGWRAALLSMSQTIGNAWQQVRRAGLVHSGVAGWPVPLGLFVNPFAVICGKPLVIIVESAFWRPAHGSRPGRVKRLRSSLHEAFARWTLRHATIAIYTHEGYMETLPVGPSGKGVVIPASWISESLCLPASEAQSSWSVKAETPRFVVASCLEEAKGIGFLLDVLATLDRDGHRIDVDLIGDGSLRDRADRLVHRLHHVRLRVLRPIPYGEEFFRFICGYSAVIVPTVGDEQPRIIYDAFSQAVPVVATDTPGNRQVLADGQTGFVVPAEDEQGFAAALIRIAGRPDQLARMGMAALEVARSHTHERMHARRAEVLADIMSALEHAEGSP